MSNAKTDYDKGLLKGTLNILKTMEEFMIKNNKKSLPLTYFTKLIKDVEYEFYNVE